MAKQASELVQFFELRTVNLGCFIAHPDNQLVISVNVSGRCGALILAILSGLPVSTFTRVSGSFGWTINTRNFASILFSTSEYDAEDQAEACGWT